MANRIEAARDYLGSVANRAIGRSAWREAMRVEFNYSQPDGKPAWARTATKALFQALPYFMLEGLAPATSRDFVAALKNPSRWEKPGWILDPPLRIVTDLALIGATVYLSHNPLEFVAMKLAANAAIHVGLDMASVVGRGATRLFRHFRPPTAIILAV